MDNQEGLPAMPKSPTLPDDWTPNRWPTATPSPPKMSWDSDSGGRFSNSDHSSDESAVEEMEEIVDLTLPTPSQKLMTEFFKLTKRLPWSGGTAYFLQLYNPRPTPGSGLATGQSSTLPSNSKGPATEASTDGKKKGAGMRSAVNKTYTLSRKLKTLHYVANFSETEASRHFGIPRTTIQGWKGLDKQPKERSTLKKKCKKHKNKSGAGCPITYGEDLDMSLYQWVLEMRDLHLPVHNAQIKWKAIEMIKPSHPSFKASTGWLTRFKTRHSLVNRQQTSVQQKLPARLEDKLRRFLEDLRALQIQHKFDKSLIINMDETPMVLWYATEHSCWCSRKEGDTCSRAGAHKRRFTVTLACTASGTMLTPFVTFKAKTDWALKKMTYNVGDIDVTNQPKGWMDGKLMNAWTLKVLVKYTKGRHALLIFNTFKGHLTEDVLQRLESNNITVVTVPGSCTSKVQPLDVYPWTNHSKLLCVVHGKTTCCICVRHQVARPFQLQARTRLSSGQSMPRLASVNRGIWSQGILGLWYFKPDWWQREPHYLNSRGAAQFHYPIWDQPGRGVRWPIRDNRWRIGRGRRQHRSITFDLFPVTIYVT